MEDDSLDTDTVLLVSSLSTISQANIIPRVTSERSRGFGIQLSPRIFITSDDEEEDAGGDADGDDDDDDDDDDYDDDDDDDELMR